MDFNIQIHGVINIFGLQFLITDTTVSTWIIGGVLILFALVVRIKSRNFKEVPTGLQNVIETVVEAFENYLHTTVGGKLMFLGNWFFTVFVFILLSNISGMFGLRPPTADWATTVGLAVVSFILIQVIGIKFRGGEYLTSFIKPYYLSWLFLPINLIGEIARPISLSFRLFGNILAGTVMMTLVYSLMPWFLQIGLPAGLHGFFDLFAGVLQTYIFVTLSLSFIKGAAAVDESPTA